MLRFAKYSYLLLPFFVMGVQSSGAAEPLSSPSDSAVPAEAPARHESPVPTHTAAPRPSRPAPTHSSAPRPPRPVPTHSPAPRPVHSGRPTPEPVHPEPTHSTAPRPVHSVRPTPEPTHPEPTHSTEPQPTHSGHPTPEPSHPEPTHSGHPTPEPSHPAPRPTPRPTRPVPVGVEHHNGNTVPASHLADISKSKQRADTVMKNNVHVTTIINRTNITYVNVYRPVIEQRTVVIDRDREMYRPRYVQTWGPQYHFWGFGWSSPEVVSIDVDFENPCFFFFFADDTNWDENYFVTWYGSDYYSYPEFNNHFRRPWVFFPSSAFEDLTFGVAAWEIPRQLAFRDAMSDLTVRLETNLSAQLSTAVELDKSSITLDHYQLLDDAVVINGSVIVDGQAYPYEAVLDLDNEGNDLVYVATVSGDPQAADISVLNDMNDRIIELGGTLEVGQ